MNTITTKFAERFGISVHQVARLKTKINKAADAQTEEHNTDATSDTDCNEAERYAQTLGITLDWSPGLYPMLIKGDNSEHLPD